MITGPTRKEVESVGKAYMVRHHGRVMSEATLASCSKWDIIGIDFPSTDSWPMAVAGQ